MEVLDIAVVLIIIIAAFLVQKWMNIQSEIAYNKYRIERKKLLKATKSKKKDSDEQADEVEDFIESLPSWLRATAEGANVDLEGVFYGDEEELKKVKGILDKNFGEKAASEDVIR